MGKRAGYQNIPGFRSVAVGGLSQFGLMAQDGLRELFESIEQGPEFSILVSGRAKQGHYITGEFHIDRFALGLVGPLEIRPVAFGRVVAASALGLTALHHSLQKRPFAEVLQLLKFPI